MLSLTKRTRKPATRPPFQAPRWEEDHPEFLRIDSTLPKDHHARWLATVVSHLDLTALRRSYAGYGSLAYPVEYLLPFVLFMYSQSVLSPADWCHKAKYDNQARWLLRGLVPSRSHLYSFRDRLEPYLDDWQAQIIAWAIFEKITTAQRGSLDGSFVAALASRHRLLSCRRVDQRLLLLRLVVWCEDHQVGCPLATLQDDLAGWGMLAADVPASGPQAQAGAHAEEVLNLLALAVLPPRGQPHSRQALVDLLALLAPVLDGQVVLPTRLPAWVPQSAAGRRRVLKRYEQAQQRLAQRLLPYQHKKKLSKKDQEAIKRLKVSLTDPEAALGWDKVGTYRPLYNLVLVQATDCALTLAWDLLGCNNDQGLIKAMMEKTQKRVGHYLKELLVDGGFLNVSDVVWCEQAGIVIYAPAAKVQTAKGEVAKGEAAKSKEEKSGGKKEEKLAKSAFRYDAVEKVYHCPQGKRLEVAYQTSEKRQSGMELPVVVHRARGQDCSACEQQKGCTSNPKKGRVVKRYEGEEALERLERRMAEPANQQIYKLRCCSVELGYADLKEHRGLRVFRCFGKARCRAQAGLTILASNGLKIMTALSRRQKNVQAASTQEKRPA